jgi:hypothetical protein
MCDQSNTIIVVDTDDYDKTRIIKKTYVSKTTGTKGLEYEVLNLLNLNPNPIPNTVEEEGDGEGEISAIPAEKSYSGIEQYRSAICRNGRILSMGVPKGLEFADFKQKYPVGFEGGDGLYVSQVIEGTMINLFFDHETELWEIATKGAVGGNYWFLRTQYPSIGMSSAQLTFRQMFLEACGVPCMTTEGEGVGVGVGVEEGVETDLNEIPFLTEFDKDLVYSFVLQHPLNHIIGWVNAPALYLVSVYRKLACGRAIEYISPTVYESWGVFSESPVRFPKRFEFCGYDELYGWVAGAGGCPTGDYTFAGVMVTNIATGERCRVDNPGYLEALRVRGNHPNLQYHYLTLLRNGADYVNQFLSYFPWYQYIFDAFYMQFAEFVRCVHQSYVDRYVRKIVAEGCVPKKYMPHIWRLHHQVYLPSLAVATEGGGGGGVSKVIVKRNVVETYVLGLEVKEVIHYLKM